MSIELNIEKLREERDKDAQDRVDACDRFVHRILAPIMEANQVPWVSSCWRGPNGLRSASRGFRVPKKWSILVTVTDNKPHKSYTVRLSWATEPDSQDPRWVYKETTFTDVDMLRDASVILPWVEKCLREFLEEYGR